MKTLVVKESWATEKHGTNGKGKSQWFITRLSDEDIKLNTHVTTFTEGGVAGAPLSPVFRVAESVQYLV